MIEKKYDNVFDVPVKSVTGEENFLQQFKGKILFFVNTTGQCGNAGQWPLIQKILDEYKEKGVEIIYTPTNDYCGSVTFNDYVYGIEKGQLSADYAFNTYGIRAPFTELVSSRNKVWRGKNLSYDFDAQKWTDTILLPDMSMEQPPRDPIYQFLTPDPDKEILSGNFHKIITNKKGQPVAFFHNGTLVDGAYKAWKNSLIENKFEWSHLPGEPVVNTAKIEEANLRAVLDEIINTDQCSDIRYKYEPYNNIYPEWLNTWWK